MKTTLRVQRIGNYGVVLQISPASCWCAHRRLSGVALYPWRNNDICREAETWAGLMHEHVKGGQAGATPKNAPAQAAGLLPRRGTRTFVDAVSHRRCAHSSSSGSGVHVHLHAPAHDDGFRRHDHVGREQGRDDPEERLPDFERGEEPLSRGGCGGHSGFDGSPRACGFGGAGEPDGLSAAGHEGPGVGDYAPRIMAGEGRVRIRATAL